MRDAIDTASISRYWGRENLGQTILDALAAAGKNLDALTITDVAATDHFHSGGMPATVRLARLAGLQPGRGCSTPVEAWAGRRVRWPSSSAAASPPST
jgi:hypothetical protein